MLTYRQYVGECMHEANRLLVQKNNVKNAIAAHIIIEGVNYLLVGRIAGRAFLPSIGSPTSAYYKVLEALGETNGVEPLGIYIQTLDKYSAYNIEGQDYDTNLLREVISAVDYVMTEEQISYIPDQKLVISPG